MGRNLVLAVLATLCVFAAPAGAEVRQLEYRVGPIEVSPYQVKQEAFQAGIPKPDVDGAITAMDVDLVDADGSPVPIQRLMLHHIVFSTLGSPIGSKRDPTCPEEILGLDPRTRFPGLVERFYAAGEERARFALPPGHGYPVGGDDTWGMTWMVMNHRDVTDRAFIRYRVTYDTDASLTPVTPVWLDAGGCKMDPIYDVRGGGRPGSVDERTAEYRVPADSRVVAAGGHVHGGGLSLDLSVPECANRPIGSMRPTWGGRRHPFYTVKPVLHEPGPIAMQGWTSAQGMPVGAGQTLRLTSRYDAHRPHTRVMGISIAMLAPARSPQTEACPALPGDVVREPRPPGRTSAPEVTVPLTGLDRRGRAVRIARPPGRLFRARGDATVRVRDFRFSRPNLSVPRGATVDWRFGDDVLHDVTLASGPRGFSSPHQGKGGRFSETFDTPGDYKLFCSLHPVAMTERVRVRRG